MNLSNNTIYEIIEQTAPLKLAESWDNCGLQVGSKNQKLKKIYLALDPTYEVVLDAKKHKANLIITHHPLIFSGLKSIDLNTQTGKIIDCCLKNDITIFSFHTNFDSAKGCLNDFFAEKIGLQKTKVLFQNEFQKNSNDGLGRVGLLKQPVKFKQFIKQVKEALGLSTIKILGDLNKEVKKIAINTGSGSSFVQNFIKSGADVYISGDIKYHSALDIKSEKLACIDAGHFHTECFFTDLMYRILKEGLNKKGQVVEIIKSVIEEEPFDYF